VKLKEQLATIQVGESSSISPTFGFKFGSHCQKLSPCWHRSFGTETELHTSCFSLGFEMMVYTFPTGLMQVQVQVLAI
jgi:hypothetical protein